MRSGRYAMELASSPDARAAASARNVVSPPSVDSFDSSDIEERDRSARETLMTSSGHGRVIRVQRGESVGCDVSTCGAYAHHPSRQMPCLRLPAELPPSGRLSDRISTRILARELKRGEPCGWCRRPCAKSWLMVNEAPTLNLFRGLGGRA